MELLAISLLNGLSYGLLLFMLGAGLTMVFSLMGVMNFAHASFYMLGAYFGWTLTRWLGFWPALLLAPLFTGLLGMAVERWGLRRVHRQGQAAELLYTFGLAYLIEEAVHLLWGRAPLDARIPAGLEGTLFTLYSSPFPVYRGFMMAIALLMLLAIWLALTRTRAGLVVQAALGQPQMAEALGHDVPRVFMLVFGGGAALAGLAGVVGGAAFVTEPGMAAAMGPIIFVVVVVGGMGSLAGAFLASLLVGVAQTLCVALDASLGTLGLPWMPAELSRITLAQMAPVVPYLLMAGVLLWRPRGLLGRRTD